VHHLAFAGYPDLARLVNHAPRNLKVDFRIVLDKPVRQFIHVADLVNQVLRVVTLGVVDEPEAPYFGALLIPVVSQARLPWRDSWRRTPT
jgi:hypothetical protein